MSPTVDAVTVVTIRVGMFRGYLTPAVAILPGLCFFLAPKQAKVNVENRASQGIYGNGRSGKEVSTAPAFRVLP